MAGLVEGPAFTRPRVWRGHEVPPVLLSGDHGAIVRWRRDSALRRTALNRPDLVERLRSPEKSDDRKPLRTAQGGLDERDREVLAKAGFPVTGEGVAH